MNTFYIQSLIATIDELVFSHTGEHLGDLQQAILEGTLSHQKYAEIAKNNDRSEKYIRDLAGRLWQTISQALGEEVSKSNIKSTLKRYHFSIFPYSNIVDSGQIYNGSIYKKLPENELKHPQIYQKAKLEAVSELLKEGLSIEQITRALKLPLELVQQQLQHSK